MKIASTKVKDFVEGKMYDQINDFCLKVTSPDTSAVLNEAQKHFDTDILTIKNSGEDLSAVYRTASGSLKNMADHAITKEGQLFFLRMSHLVLLIDQSAFTDERLDFLCFTAMLAGHFVIFVSAEDGYSSECGIRITKTASNLTLFEGSEADCHLGFERYMSELKARSGYGKSEVRLNIHQ